MTLVRSDPFGEIERLVGWLAPDGATRSFGIPLDAYRQGERFVIELDLPGVRAEDTELTIEGGTLTVRATRRPPEHADGEWLIAERRTGTFTRQVVHGDTLDTGQVEANFSDGVLTITIPVAAHAKPRRIEIHREERSPELATAGT